MDISNKLRERRLELGLTLEEVGNIVGVGKSTVRKWETGAIENMKRDKIAQLAKALQVSPSFIMGWNEPKNNVINDLSQYGNILPISTQKIPLLGEISCGQPIFANEDRESYVESNTEIKADFCLKAKGDSMINARIYDGDIVFIKKQDMVNNGEIAAVIIDDEATLKRIYYQNGEKLMLVPENPAYSPLVYVGEELNQIHILGKAIAFQSDVV